MATALNFTPVLSWFDVAERDLPWRRPGVSAWQILVSEVMLQQTPVARVEPVWHEWVARWPRPRDLAEASAGDAVRAWGRLGYPRRAMRLHACAVALVERHGGGVPSSVDELLGLPGVGEYTARAVACFAFGQDVPVVDINVRRVLARAAAGEAEAGNPSPRRDLAAAQKALESVPGPRRPRLSAGLMELGALVCTARSPLCGECPLGDSCAWVAAGRPAWSGPAKRVQRFEGTDRQARGRLMAVLRGESGPVARAALDVVWPQDPAQRDRALDSLLVDGLVEQTRDGRFALAGEGERR
ncbi:A/G-specific adenine glycosylase [Tsukamurella sp. 8F]|uniref:A/G-specific adenine glycosylase n=1 Tax=unclassified Tsukamurella TaxID=2633480 RepID=UPI0023B99C26|nr:MULTISPECIES: A/G-specific adenine glycosylase [unclassified Tsukamurella]MDF0532196.1 A/G-specific adenine glycosylase [Tsukamurella sp. 8J]MDF0589241.1 A/G-specific adenine glycosylase [Tsukamurella sp. 8F]